MNLDKAMTELAGIIKSGGKVKEVVNTAAFAVYIGTVEATPPELQVRLNANVILYKNNLIISAAVLKNYEREFEIFNAGQESIQGRIKWTDELAVGDKVIILPTQSDDLYILVEKAVEL